MFQKIIDFFVLPYLKVYYALKSQLRREREIDRYYHHSLFKALDLRLKGSYKTMTPYKVVKEYEKNKHLKKNSCIYGETPLRVYENFAKRWQISEKDVYLELGSGIGRGVFFLSLFFQCKAIGIEWVKPFTQTSNALKSYYQLKDIFFTCEDMFKADLPKASFIYLFGTCLSQEEIIKVCKNIKRSAIQAKVISVSFPLNEYDKDFTVQDEFCDEFEFGKTSIYLNQVRC